MTPTVFALLASSSLFFVNSAAFCCCVFFSVRMKIQFTFCNNTQWQLLFAQYYVFFALIRSHAPLHGANGFSVADKTVLAAHESNTANRSESMAISYLYLNIACSFNFLLNNIGDRENTLHIFVVCALSFYYRHFCRPVVFGAIKPLLCHATVM